MSQIFQTAASAPNPGDTPQYSGEQETRQLRRKVAELEQEVHQSWQTMQRILEQTEQIQAKNELLQNENMQMKREATGISQNVLQAMQQYIDETQSCCEGMIHRAEQEVADIRSDAQAKSEQLLQQTEKEQTRRLLETEEEIRKMKEQAQRQAERREDQLTQAKRLMQCLQDYMEDEAADNHG